MSNARVVEWMGERWTRSLQRVEGFGVVVDVRPITPTTGGSVMHPQIRPYIGADQEMIAPYAPDVSARVAECIPELLPRLAGLVATLRVDTGTRLGVGDAVDVYARALRAHLGQLPPHEPTAKDQRAFDRARARYLDAQSREDTYRLEVILRKYGSLRPSVSWLNRTETAKLETFARARDRAGEALLAVLDRVGCRQWRSGVPYHWIMSNLSWDDATTRDALSVVPPCAYGSSARDMERFARAIDAAS
jgi:hypothetical protein